MISQSENSQPNKLAGESNGHASHCVLSSAGLAVEVRGSVQRNSAFLF